MGERMGLLCVLSLNITNGVAEATAALATFSYLISFFSGPKHSERLSLQKIPKYH